MYISRQSSIIWKVFIICLQVIAIASTLLRLAFRYRRGRIWLDDYLMVPVVILEVIAVIIIWFLYENGGSVTQSEKTQKALYWSSSISWFGLIWHVFSSGSSTLFAENLIFVSYDHRFSRTSLALSLTRIFPVWGTIRRSSRGISMIFAIFYVGVMSWLFTSSCARLVDPTNKPGTNILDCNSERRSLTITNFVGDITASCILIFYLIFILAKITMDRGQKVLTLTLMASCMFIFLTSILYCAFSFSPTIKGTGRQFVAGMLSEMETVISVIACNTLAFVTYLWRNDPGTDGVNDQIEWRKSRLNESKSKEKQPTNVYPLKADPSKGTPGRHDRDNERYHQRTSAKAAVGPSK